MPKKNDVPLKKCSNCCSIQSKKLINHPNETFLCPDCEKDIGKYWDAPLPLGVGLLLFRNGLSVLINLVLFFLQLSSGTFDVISLILNLFFTIILAYSSYLIIIKSINTQISQGTAESVNIISLFYFFATQHISFMSITGGLTISVLVIRYVFTNLYKCRYYMNKRWI